MSPSALFRAVRAGCRIRIGCDDIVTEGCKLVMKGEPMTDKIAPCLWFDGRAEEAAGFYAVSYTHLTLPTIYSV